MVKKKIARKTISVFILFMFGVCTPVWAQIQVKAVKSKPGMIEYPPYLLSKKIDSILKSDMGKAGPGGAVAVLKNGKLIDARTYGLANIEDSTKITARTVFDVVSMAKQFTALATLLLVSDGKISLSDDVHKYIPELPDYGTPIQIAHLIHQTSGLRDYSQLFDLTDTYGEVSVITQAAVFQMIMQQRHLNFTPGAEFLYSNTNYYLLSIIIARVSGHSFENFMQSRIFGPLGMN
jgi:CubicO group peptidase (beta-lactamase class C family)